MQVEFLDRSFLDNYFVHRLRKIDGMDRNPLNEVRVLANSMLENGSAPPGSGSVSRKEAAIKLDPETSVLKLKIGDPIALYGMTIPGSQRHRVRKSSMDPKGGKRVF